MNVAIARERLNEVLRVDIDKSRVENCTAFAI